MKINPDKRIKCIVSLLYGGKRLLDIGTDHAYLPAYCVEKGLFERAIVSDINDGPLEKAQKTILENNLDGKITAVKSDGFRSLPENCANEVVIAGMGGILISEILAEAQWLKNEGIHLVLQPMTHAEDVRLFLSENGFSILREKACIESGKPYCVISAEYRGEIVPHEEGYYFYGELSKDTSEEAVSYLKKVFASLIKKLNGLKCSGDDKNEIMRLEKVKADFIERTRINYAES